MDQLHVRWRTSAHDLRHGIPRDAAPHVVAALVAGAWVVAPSAGGSGALRWLGVAVLVVQVLHVVRVVARRVRRRRVAEQQLTVHGTSFVLTDQTGATTYDAPLVGVEDDRGVLRLDFADGRTLEAPWRAFTHAALRRLRQHLRVRLGEDTDLHHVPVRRIGEVSGAGAWPRPVLALVVAVLLALLPWVLPQVVERVRDGGPGGASTVAAGATAPTT